eukprot:scaffold22060_cov21-Tisochrysis_lutea.AAC.1
MASMAMHDTQGATHHKKMHSDFKDGIDVPSSRGRPCECVPSDSEAIYDRPTTILQWQLNRRGAVEGAPPSSEHPASGSSSSSLQQLQQSSMAPAAALAAFSGHSGAPDVDWGTVMKEALSRKEIECPIWCAIGAAPAC